jgi:outer membrane protein TolC
VRLEYSRALDQRGLDAELRQALLDRDIAREQQRLAQEDLQYGVASLAAEIDANFASLDGFSASLAAEEAKLSEARERYRQGREETDRLIQFASELSAAEFAAEQQNIDLTRRLIEVDVVRGVVWQAIQAVVKNTSSVEMDFTSGDKALSR